MLSKWKSRFGLFAVLAMIATFLVVVPASAIVVTNGAGSDSVSTGATVGGANYAPTILCKWEIPDANRDAEDGMQYSNDDLGSSTAGFPCTGDFDTGITYDPTKAVMEVQANADNSPTERMIELWVAAQGANGSAVGDVFWKIYHPDGSLKIQTHGTRLADPTGRDGVVWATDANTDSNWDLTSNGMWAAASSYGTDVRTGQISPATVKSDLGLISQELQGQLELWSGSFLLDKHQPCGLYTVDAYATSAITADYAMTTNTLEVLCFTNLETDFTSVDWGTITPGQKKIVAGDAVYQPGDGRPTVMNTGSGAMTLSVRFSPMRWEGDEPGTPSTKVIDVFDAAFGLSAGTILVVDPIPAGETAYFGSGEFQTLCANESGKLDLSIHPKQTGLIGGSYSGTLTLIASHTPNGVDLPSGPCLNEAGVWGGGAPVVRFSNI